MGLAGFIRLAGNLYIHMVDGMYFTYASKHGCSSSAFFPRLLIWVAYMPGLQGSYCLHGCSAIHVQGVPIELYSAIFL